MTHLQSPNLQKMVKLWSLRDRYGQQWYSGRLWYFKMLSLYQGADSLPRKYPPYLDTTRSSLNHLYKAGLSHACMLFKSNSVLWISKEKSRLIRPGKVYPVFCFPVLANLCKVQPHFLVNRSGPLLLLPICIKVNHDVYQETLFCKPWL